MKTVVELKSLTGLRGIAALYVVVYHLFFGAAVLAPLHYFLSHGYLAVDLFFVLSGFVMTMVYGDDFLAGRFGRVFPDFLYKRIGRVYPLYLFVLLIYVTLSQLGIIQNHQADVWTILVNGLMLQSVLLLKSISPPSWSISTEMIAYLVFPLVVWWLHPFRALKVMVLTVLCLAVLCVIALMPGVLRTAGPLDIYNTVQVYPLLRCLAVFTLGVVAFRLSRHPLSRTLASYRAATPAVAAAMLILMCLPGTDLIVVVLFGALVILLSVAPSGVERALSHPAVHWLGLVSYSIYLDHQIMSDALRERLAALLRDHGVPHAPTAASVILLPAIVLVAGVTFYMIEQPARNMFRHAARLRLTPMAADPSAP